MKREILNERKLAKGEPLSDSQKILIIMDSYKCKKKWNKDLNKEQKHKVLEGMDIGLDEAWILSLMEDVA